VKREARPSVCGWGGGGGGGADDVLFVCPGCMLWRGMTMAASVAVPMALYSGLQVFLVGRLP
jgi:hypothetical protein